MIRLLLSLFLLFAPLAANAQVVNTVPTTFVKNSQALLGRLNGANFNTATDQSIVINTNVTKYLVTGIYATNCSASLTLAAGGFYTASSKGGTILVAAAQVYSALTASTVLLPTTLAAGAVGTALTGSSIFLSLTTGQGSAATCDIYVYGVDLT